MIAEWYYAKGNQRVGPFTEAQLKEYAVSGQLLPTDMVWKQGMAKWEQAFAVAGLLPKAAPPPLPPQEMSLREAAPETPTPEPTKPHAGVFSLLMPFLSEDWRRAFHDFFASWRQLRLATRIAVSVFGVVVLALILWQMFRGGDSSSSNGLWDRIWQSGVVTGLVTLAFAFLKKKLVDQPTVSTVPGEAAPVPVIDAAPGEDFLGLSARQWLSLLVALFLPTLLASLVSSFLIGNEVHYYLSGPILVILGMAIAGLSARLPKSGFEQQAQLGAIVGTSPVLVYALSCLNARWVLLFYTLLVTLPALQLFIVCRQGVPALRFILPLKVGIGVLGLVLFLGVMALPREGASDPSRLVGTWVQVEKNDFGRTKTVTFSKGGTATIDVGYSLPPAKYTFSDKKIQIDAEGMKGKYTVDFVSDDEIVLVGEDSFARMSHLEGRWKKNKGSEGSKDKEPAHKDARSPVPKGGDDDDKTPNLDSPLASKLLGQWKSTTGKTKGFTVEFTKAGKVVFTPSGMSRPDSSDTVLGTYSFKKDAVLQLDQAGATRFDHGWKVDIEFISDDVILFVNHGHPYGGFGPLAGRFERSK